MSGGQVDLEPKQHDRKSMKIQNMRILREQLEIHDRHFGKLN